MLNKKAVIMLKFLIGIILGSIILLLTYRVAEAVLSTLFLQDDENSFSNLFEAIETLGDNKEVQLELFVNEDHLLVGFNKGKDIVNNIKRPVKCGEKACICKCSNEANSEVCKKPAAQCLVFKEEFEITHEKEFQEELAVVRRKEDLFIRGRFKQLLTIKRAKNLITIGD